MPNIRQLRKRETKTSKWTKEAMQKAMQEVQAGRLTSRQAARQFSIPRSTLTSRLSGRVADDSLYGKKQLLTVGDENSLAEYCLYSASQGFPLTKTQVVALALAIYNYRNPEKPKTALGDTWWINFKERHHLCIVSQTVDFTNLGKESCMRTKLTADFLWLLTSTMEEKGLKEKPCQIYTCAKTKFKLYFDKKKVPQKIKHSDIQTKRAKNVITILACFNAAGEDIPPLIIYKGKYLRGDYTKEGLPNALYGTSAAGDLDGEMFKKWFIEHFLEFAVRDRPLLLIMDGQVNPELVQDAQREEVILLYLPPHTSHILQPLDVSFFGPLKSDFSEITGDPLAETHSFSVSKKEFSRVLRDCYQRLKDQRLVVDGFRRCGLYPLYPTAIDPSQVMSSALQPENLAPAPSTQLSSCLHPTHPLVALGQIPADLIQVLTKTYQTCNTSKVSRNARVLISQKRSDVIMKAEDCTSEIETQTQLRQDGVHQNRIENSGATSYTLPDSSCPSSNRGQPSWDSIATTSASHSPSEEEEYQNSFIPLAPLSSGSSSTTAGPTTSTDHIAAKRTKMMRILRCGRCRQSYPPCDPEGLVLWVQCNNCHKLFHTICVSSEMDLDEEEFWCFWCLDV